MSSTRNSKPVTRAVWAGRIISAVPVLFLLFDSSIKLMNIAPVTESFIRLGYRSSIAVAIGLLELACLIVYIVPRTSILGAIILTGYLGGAVATHVRVGDPLFSHSLFPVYVGLFLWIGLLLRNENLKTVFQSGAHELM
jgi:hypothetical protein